MFEKKEKSDFSDQVAAMKNKEKATEKEISGLRKSLSVELSERRKLVDGCASHNANLDELDRVSLVVQTLKKEVKGLQKELRSAEESAVAVLKYPIKRSFKTRYISRKHSRAIWRYRRSWWQRWRIR